MPLGAIPFPDASVGAVIVMGIRKQSFLLRALLPKTLVIYAGSPDTYQEMKAA
jgi:hypothetical protein